MPTIDQLAPATSASDQDEFLVSQAGTARKITRTQILSGVQPQIAIQTGTLLGRMTAGTGTPESIAIGQNLSLNTGTLSASAAPFQVSQLPAGVVPSPSDLLVVGQSGTNVSVSYRQLLGGLASIPNVDASQAVVTPTGSKSASKLADLTAIFLPVTGGSMTGTLTLATDPASPGQAATKSYVDAQAAGALLKTGGTLSGPLVLAADPAQPVQAATKSYVDAQVATSLPRTGGALSGTVTLAGDPTAPLQAATKQYVDQRAVRSGDTLTGPLVLAADPVASMQASTKGYVDGQTGLAFPRTGGAVSGAITLPGDPVASLQAATKQYVDARLVRSGDTMTGPLVLASDPVTNAQAATKGYVDGQFLAAMPKAGGTLTGPLALAADPAGALQAATKQYVDVKANRSGDTLTGPLILAADPVTGPQAATKSYVDTTFAASVPKVGGTLTGLLTLSADPTASMHAVTKRYVDSQSTSGLPLSGGTLSGALTLAGSPATSLQAATKQYVDGQVGGLLPNAGGTLTGPLTLALAPTAPLHAATKQYVDANPGPTGVINVKLPPYNAALNGVTDDTAAFKAAYQAAAAGGIIYVPHGVTVLQQPSTWGVALTKRVKWIVDGVTLADGTPLSAAVPTGGAPANLMLPGLVSGNSAGSIEVFQGSSQGTDFAVLHASYVVNHNGGSTNTVIANTRNDTVILNAPNSFVWGGLDRLVWAGVQSPTVGSPAQHVARYVQTVRVAANASSASALPQPEMWAACLEYRDTTGVPSSLAGASLTVEMDWYGNGADDAKSRQIQSLVVGQHDTTGAPVEVSTVIGVYLAGGSTGRVYKVFNIGIPFSTAILDTTNSQQLAGAAAIRLAAGHSIAFEPTNSVSLAYDSATSTLRLNQGALSFVVGRGITVGFQSVFSASFSIPSYMAGNIVFLVGSGNYTMTLPPANSIAAGTGFTFSAIGSGVVSIVTSGSDGIENAPVILRQNDRLHVISDGTSVWRELFRVNSVSPRFLGPPVLPSYSVAGLPSAGVPGAKAYASNGRKPSEAAGAGTGVEVFSDGQRWISVCSGSQVAA
jgi:hypothetical protein